MNPEHVEIKDLVGNTSEATITITNIDKVNPEIEVSYSTQDPTNQDVVVTIKSNKAIKDVEGSAAKVIHV